MGNLPSPTTLARRLGRFSHLLPVLAAVVVIGLASSAVVAIVGPLHAAIKTGEPAHTAVLTDVERRAAKQRAVQQYEKSLAQIDRQAASGTLTPEQRDETMARQRQMLYQTLARLNGGETQQHPVPEALDIE